MLRIWCGLTAAAAAAAAAGCSTVGGAFGLSPPQYKLTDETKALKAAQSAAPAPLPKETAKALLPPFVVEPGDTLLVQPADLDSPIRLPGDQVVLADGTIDLGRYGRPVVAGKTVPAIEADVQRLVRAGVRDLDPPSRELLAGRPPVVNVRLTGRASKVYYVLGEVNSPGAFPVTGRETVLDGIIAAGNLTRRASQTNVVLARPTSPDGCRIVLPICLTDIEQQADPSTNYQLLPGDRIFVPSAGLFDDLFGRRKGECPPCHRPPSACPIGAGGPVGDPACPPPAAAAAPVVPAVGP